jgi:pentatricopeptide repeat domain-containing protein 3
MRDPNAVLKALASTVSPLKHPFVMGRSLADPLVPKNRRQMMEFLMAETAGRKAAMEVIRRNPKIFPAFQPVPDIQETSEPPPSGLNEENLKRLILSRRSERSLRVYTRLKDKGETVSLATQNLLLKLLAYYGTGCTFTPSTENPPEASKVVPIQDYSMALSHSQYKVIWNEDCEAEKLFAEMEHKDGRTYSAMIEGLMKFKQHKRGMELFNEAREKGLQLTVDAYNSILQSLPSTKDNKIWSKANSILIEMTKQPAVMLDVSTINAMLGVACATGISSRNYGMEVIREAVHLGIKLNLTSFIELLRCFSNHGDYTVMYSIMDYIEENPDIVTVQNPTDVYFFTVAINFVRLLQDSDLAYRLKQHAMKDNWYLVRSLDYFFNSYLSTMCGSNLVRFMEEYESIVPTVSTKNTITLCISPLLYY